MHIAINTSPLISGHSLRGIGTYTKQLIWALQQFEPAHTYTLVTKSSQIPINADIVHYPFFDPFFLTLPIQKAKPTVVTVHDLIPIRYAKHFSIGIRGKVKWNIQRFSLMAASGVITDSQYSKNDICEFAGIPEEKIHVVYLAPSKEIHPITDRNILKQVAEKYNLSKLFILYVGDVNWNKNILGLLHAFRQIKLSNKNVQLVFVGNAFVNTEISEVKQIDNLISSLRLSSSVQKLGYIPNEDLAGLYSLAACLVLPSFAEGFGLPILEAFTCGCPVVAARGSSLSEISGPAITVNPHDPSDIARGLTRTLRVSSIQRHQIAKEGYKWVKQFTWRHVARQTVAIYHHVLGQRKAI